MNKKFLMLSLLVCSSISMWAEHSVGVQIGFAEPIYRLNSPLSSEKRSHLDATPLNGMKFGIVYDASLIKGFGFSMGMNYTFAFAETKWKDYPYDAQGKSSDFTYYEYRTQYQYHQGEIFVDWQYKFEIAKKTYLILYSGPTIQCLFKLQAKDYYRSTFPGTDIQKTIDSDEAKLDDYMQRLNVTWGVGAGFQYKRYFLRGGYDFGIINPYKKQSFSDLGYPDEEPYSSGRLTRGRLDQWQIKLGIYLWQSENN